MGKESVAKPFYSVLILAFVCSLLVSTAAVNSRLMQEKNRELDRKKNILRAAQMYDPDQPIDTMFSTIETRIIELSTGEFVPESQLSAKSFNQIKAAHSSDLGRSLDKEEDIAGLHRVEKFSFVYLVKDGPAAGQVILPVRGKGLWSTMYAYVALDADLTTILGISFYEHGETPGLGGEIENEKWLAGWQGKQMYSPSGTVAIQVVHGEATDVGDNAQYQIDGLSGATMTSKGVNNLMHFWFGDHGFKPFLERYQRKGGSNG